MANYTRLSPAYFYQKMKSLGWNDNAIYGLLGNIEAESNFGIDRWQEGSDKNINNRQTGYGLIQLSALDRKANFKKVTGVDLVGSTADQQIEFLDWELKNPFKKVGESIQNAASVKDASTTVLKKFEIPANADSKVNERASNSLDWQERLSGVVDKMSDVMPDSQKPFFDGVMDNFGALSPFMNPFTGIPSMSDYASDALGLNAFKDTALIFIGGIALLFAGSFLRLKSK